MVALAGVFTWLFAAGAHGPLPAGNFEPNPTPRRLLSGADAEQQRLELIARADAFAPPHTVEPLPDFVVCRFLNGEPTGTTAKFDCVLDGGAIVKVKYGRNAEIHAEAAATRLLDRLGFAADRIDIVPRLRCYGCPRFPFFTMRLLALADSSRLLDERGLDGRFMDFAWVAVERRFPAPAVETDRREGFAWYELAPSASARAEIDAFRLLAVFLAHWDNKEENQRLVCLDDACDRPLLMMQDVGATFGPMKVNLERWRSIPVWQDAAQCTVSMRQLPWQGATFSDTAISEEGRALLAERLAALTQVEIRALFAGARFPEFYAATDDDRDLDAWTTAFRQRVDQVVSAGPCPNRSSAPSG